MRRRAGARRLGLAAAIASVAALLTPAIAVGAAIDVTTVEDELNADGDCSLREAVQSANDDAAVAGCAATGDFGADEVVLPADDHPLTLAGADEDSNATGDLDLLDPAGITIAGAGAQSSAILAAYTEGGDRLIEQHAGPLTVDGLTLRDGSVEGAGGAIRSETFAEPLTVLDSAFEENGATFTGGAISFFGTLLRIERSAFLDNTVEASGPFAVGGAIASFGTIQVSESLFSLNTLTFPEEPNFSGGAAIGALPFGTPVEPGSFLRDSAFILNVVGGAGPASAAAVAWSGGSDPLRIAESIVAGNGSDGIAVGRSLGGGSGGVVEVERSRIANNATGLTAVFGARVRIRDSLLTANAGGALVEGASLAATNSTFSGNAGGEAGALEVRFGDATLRHATVASNTGNAAQALIASGAPAEIRVGASLIGGDAEPPPLCLELDGGTIASLGGNLTEGAACGDGGGQALAADLGLQPLAANGAPQIGTALFGVTGTAQSHALALGSPAVDSIPASFCVDALGDQLAADQRGAPRPFGPACDAGAFELQVAAPALIPGDGLAPSAPPPPTECRGAEATIVGTDDADVLRGTAGRDVIAALGGDDVVRGLGGKDLVCGGDGEDALSGGKRGDVLAGGAGSDRLRGGSGPDRLIGGDGEDACVGGKGGDRAKTCARERSIP